MLLAFTATNFKSIKEPQTISMVGTSLKGPHTPLSISYPGDGNGILPCAVIYGANASGKSNLLDAFVRMKYLVHSSHSVNKNKKLKVSPFLLDEGAALRDTSLEVSFINDSIRYDYGFSYNESRISEEWLFSYPEGRRRKVFERKGMDIDFGPTMRGAKKVLAGFLSETSLFLTLAIQNNHEELSSIGKFFSSIYTSNQITVASSVLDRSFSKEEVDKRSIEFLSAIGTGICSYKLETSDVTEEHKKIVGELMKVFATYSDVEISESDLQPDEKDYELKLGHKTSGGGLHYFGGEMESAGTRRLLLLLNKIFKVLDEGDIAIIDEIDASLHTYAVEAIVQLFADPNVNKNGAQLIATTHDTNLLNPEILRRDEIWFVQKDNVGCSSYFSLAEIKSRKDEFFEKSYLQGRYGAIPRKIQSLSFA